MGSVHKGDHVIFMDRTGTPRPALVTAVWGKEDYDQTPPSINVVYVNLEAGQSDSYGQKIQRDTSVPHRKHQQAHGYYWLLVEEASVVEPA